MESDCTNLLSSVCYGPIRFGTASLATGDTVVQWLATFMLPQNMRGFFSLFSTGAMGDVSRTLLPRDELLSTAVFD